jgi:plasmid stabilization system protein ParE
VTARIVWADPVRDAFLDLPERERELIDRHFKLLVHFPEMYPVRMHGRFRRYRWFLAGDWLVFYRVLGNVIYVRGLWPARIP